MTNAEKYKSACERADAFEHFCGSFDDCKKCPLNCEDKYKESWCNYAWLDLEAAKGMPPQCPFCNGEHELSINYRPESGFRIHCGCGYSTKWFETEAEAISSHNEFAERNGNNA